MLVVLLIYFFGWFCLRVFVFLSCVLRFKTKIRVVVAAVAVARAVVHADPSILLRTKRTWLQATAPNAAVYVPQEVSDGEVHKLRWMLTETVVLDRERDRAKERGREGGRVGETARHIDRHLRDTRETRDIIKKEKTLKTERE